MLRSAGSNPCPACRSAEHWQVFFCFRFPDPEASLATPRSLGAEPYRCPHEAAVLPSDGLYPRSPAAGMLCRPPEATVPVRGGLYS